MASSPELHYWDETGGGNNAGRWRVLKALVLSEVAVNTLTSSNNGTVYSIKTPGSTNWTNIGSPYTGNSSVGTSFVKSGSNGSGSGIAIPPGTYSGGNPLLKAEVYEVLGAPRECNILIGNKPLKPFTTIFWDDDVTEAQKASPPINAQLQMFHNLFPDYMYIRLVDSLTRHILFAGRVYEQLENFNGEEYGPQIELKARDNMAELARANMAPFLNVDITTDNALSNHRSDVIKHIIQKGLWKGGHSTVGSRTMVYDNADKFHESDNVFSEAEAAVDYKIKGDKKTALKHIAELAAQDWYTDQAGTIVKGYDFHCDPEITSMRYDNEPPPSQLAYFKRMTEPTDDPLPAPVTPASAKKGMIVQYKTKADVALADSGRRFAMLPDYNFSEQPNETFTDFIVTYKELPPHLVASNVGDLLADDKYPASFTAVSIPEPTGRGIARGLSSPYDMIEDGTPITRVHNFTILYCDIPATIDSYPNGIASGKFRVANDDDDGIDFSITGTSFTEPRGDKCSTIHASKLYTASSQQQQDQDTFVGLVQYQSGVGDNQYIIISHTEFSTVLDSLGPDDTLYEASNWQEVRATTSGPNTTVKQKHGNGTQITLSGQAYPPNTLKIKRTKTLDLQQQGLNTALFRDALAMEIATGTGGTTTQRGYFSIPDFPHVKFTGNAQSGSTGTTLKPLEQVPFCGFEKGTTINHTDSNGNFYAGYASAVTVSTNLITGSLYRPSTLANESGNNNAPTGFSGWAANDAYTLLVPIRCGHVIFVDHVLAGVYGKHLITELSYTYQHGQVKTEFYTIGRNEARGALMPEYKDIFYGVDGDTNFGLPFNAVDATLSNIRWIYTDYNTLGWDIPSGGSGDILLKNNIGGGSWDIDAANTDILNGNTPMVAGKVYMLYFDHKTNQYSFQLGITEGAGINYRRKGHYIEIGRITIGDTANGENRVNFNILVGGETTNTPFNMSGLNVLTPNSLASTLLRKTMQPYQHNLTILPGKADGSYINTHVTVFSGGAYDDGVLNFADATSARVSQNYTVGDSSAITAGAVRYLYFQLNANHQSTNNVQSINWTSDYTLAVSDTRGLLAMVTKATNGLAGTYNGIPEPSEDNSDKALSIITFRGHTDTISANLIAARAITSLHITTNQIIAKDFRTAVNVGDNYSANAALAGVGGILINKDRIAGYADSVGSNNPVIEFELKAATGKAYFDGGKAIIDCDGMRFYTSSTHNASNFIAKMGYSSSLGTGALNIKGGAGISGGLIFRRSTYDGTNTGTAALITAVLSTNGNGGSATTGDDFLVSGVDMNLHLQSATNSIILQGQHGIKILQDDDANHGLLFLAGDNASHVYTSDYVGMRGPGTGTIGSITNSTIYVLPEVVTGDDEKFLKITSITGSGSIAAPYLATLDWADSGTDGVVSGGSWSTSTGELTLARTISGGTMASIVVDLDGRYSENAFRYINILEADDSNYSFTQTSTSMADDRADTLYLVAGDGIELRSDVTSASGGPAPAIRIRATSGGGNTYIGATGINIDGSYNVSLNLSELGEKQSSFSANDFFGMVTSGGTSFKIRPTYINVELFNNNNYYALNSHSHSYDNYNYWRLQGDSGSDDIISQEVVDISGGVGISTSVTSAGITITNDSPNTNQNIWYSINVAADGGTASGGTITPDSSSDLLTFRAGAGITLTTDSTNDRIDIDAHEHNSGNIITVDDIYLYGDIIDGTNNENKLQMLGNYSRMYVRNYENSSYVSRLCMEWDAYTRYSSPYGKGHVGINGYAQTGNPLYIHGTDAAAYQVYPSSLWANGSDERAKTNIASITGAVDTLKNINPVSYTWTEPYIKATGIPDRTYLGFVAQEYEQVFPNDIQTSISDLIQLEDGSYEFGEYSPKNDHHDPMPDGATMIMENMKTISPDAMVPYLVAAVKELKDEIDALKIQIGG